jgi:hypothetical protein
MVLPFLNLARNRRNKTLDFAFAIVKVQQFPPNQEFQRRQKVDNLKVSVKSKGPFIFDRRFKFAFLCHDKAINSYAINLKQWALTHV